MTNADRLHKRIRRELTSSRQSSWRLGKALMEFNAVQGWRDLGYTTAREYLDTLDLSNTAYYRYIRVWRVFSSLATRSDVDHLDFTKLDMAASAVENGTISPVQGLKDCRLFTARELRLKYGFSGGVRQFPDVLTIESVVDVLLSLLEDDSVSDTEARCWARDVCESVTKSIAEVLAK